MNWLTLPMGPEAPEVVHAIIEVPGGQANKYEFDKALHVFRLDRPLYASVHYPGDYGFIPSTVACDGDALDILVLLPQPTFSGCLIVARPIGALKMLDEKVLDEKVLAVAVSSPTHVAIHHYTDLAPHALREIEHFFSVYKELEGKRTEICGWLDARQTHELIRECHERFRSH
ncbi:MAG TPA: inorganic diphosphatase [Verrucomicrobiae bacterium]|nr:inorganic diphosphatase [Verrucomicrobiae bacterium]